jgi:peptide/nickel transport system ATP-binding protein
MSLLQVKNLVVEFPSRHGTLRALDEISFEIAPGEILGVVGESGAGKSLTGASIIGLLEPPGRVAGGEILLQGQRIDNLNNDQMRSIRGRKIGAIFQDPLTSLNPFRRICLCLIRKRVNVPSLCCKTLAFLPQQSALTTTPISFRAACVSAW